MSGVSRRRFIAGVSALAIGWGVSRQVLGDALALPMRAADVPSTLLQTIKMSSSVARGSYRTLLAGAGEDFIARVDLLGREADPRRSTSRRSLYYFAHLSDIHVIDAQTPARMDAIQSIAPELFTDACRPQDTLTTHVLASVVDSVVAAQSSSITGAPLASAISTGDSADNLSALETRWYIDILDGKDVTPNSGAVGMYEGPQIWSEATYAYHPDDPMGDVYGAYGYPTVPGMLAAAVSNPVTSQGLPVPWFAVYGNHDATYMGTFRADPALFAWAVGSRKAATGEALGLNWLQGFATDLSVVQIAINAIRESVGLLPGIRDVTADPARKLLERADFMQAHLDSPAVPGPVGHGWTQANVDSGETWWSADMTPYLRVFGLDTCNLAAGADGAVPQDQFDWLQAQLEQCQTQGRLAIVCSHHNSLTLENGATPVTGGQPLIHAEEFIDMLLRYPVCIAWLNGHTHINTLTPHLREGGVGGFWEITTASCVDFPQQQQLVELIDNRDGTLSIFVTALDHAAPPTWTPGDLTQVGLASLSRELSANAWLADPALRAGSPLDRNVELVMPAPFEMSAITDAAVESEQMRARAHVIAHRGAAS
ncbi:MAG: TIGR03767 family metallophosphoesterase [Candidatus Nanopelagicales bacterium]|jgi:metallophosphoesterase (TIGR03767 family)|nr:TIGR03767 family metallophosphoesterase [Candidatus Nanopelagicales bacterium]MDP4906686.1 TIGR03767 family metallophosphoesterase [Candidatus Nanopelagicales bacterium]MDP4974708.1 TIGR03767 family metallophosphoesterase [Candidatus Nanopelagicales bacterium]